MARHPRLRPSERDGEASVREFRPPPPQAPLHQLHRTAVGRLHEEPISSGKVMLLMTGGGTAQLTYRVVQPVVLSERSDSRQGKEDFMGSLLLGMLGRGG